jgi:hypothetical protein
VKNYEKDVTFLAVVPVNFAGQTGQVRRKFHLTIPVIADGKDTFARACSVYTTPHAAVIDSSWKLYYQGNYNKSHYCTVKNSSFGQMALDLLLADKPVATFGALAISAYGYELPEPDGYGWEIR